MTRKDYVALAAIIKNNTDKVALAHDIASWLATDNDRFDRERFLNACGVTS